MAELAYAFMRSHPADAAQVIEAVAPAEAAALFAAAPVRLGAAVLAAMLPAVAARAVDALEDERAMALLGSLRTPAAVLVLRHIDEPRRARLIAGLPTASAIASRLLLGYPEDSVGAWADPHVLAFSGETRAGAVLDRVRRADAPAERIFVVGNGQRLAGWLTLARLLRSPDGAPLDSLMSRADAVLAAQTPLAGALDHPGWLEHSALPVVEAGGRLLGLLTSDALARALGRSARRVAPGEPQSVTGVLAAGGWAAVSGMVEAAVLLLPRVPPVGGGNHER
jgi:magnesium transporter